MGNWWKVPWIAELNLLLEGTLHRSLLLKIRNKTKDKTAKCTLPLPHRPLVGRKKSP